MALERVKRYNFVLRSASLCMSHTPDTPWSKKKCKECMSHGKLSLKKSGMPQCRSVAFYARPKQQRKRHKRQRLKAPPHNPQRVTGRGAQYTHLKYHLPTPATGGGDSAGPGTPTTPAPPPPSPPGAFGQQLVAKGVALKPPWAPKAPDAI